MNQLCDYLTLMLFTVLSSGYTANAQEQEIYLRHYSVVHPELESAIDRVVENEKKCDYFDCSTLFFANVQVLNNMEISISIESQSDKNILLALDPNGFIYHQNFLVLLRLNGETNSLFKPCSEKSSFKFIDYDHPEFQKKRKNVDEILVFNDDSFSQWTFRFSENKLKVIDTAVPCFKMKKEQR